MTNKTNTRGLTCWATSKVDFRTKKFFSFIPGAANKAAKAWLMARDRKAA